MGHSLPLLTVARFVDLIPDKAIIKLTWVLLRAKQLCIYEASHSCHVISQDWLAIFPVADQAINPGWRSVFQASGTGDGQSKEGCHHVFGQRRWY